MRFVNKHILPFGRLFLSLFFLTNSGFTVVMYHCTMTGCSMTDDKTGMMCCSESTECADESCDLDAGMQTAATHVVAVDQQCMTSIIVGGNIVDPTVVEKPFSGEQILKSDLLSTAVSELPIGPRVDLPAFLLTSSAVNTSTPSVETYVLNSTFLI